MNGDPVPSCIAGPVERVATAPGAPWNVVAVFVDAPAASGASGAPGASDDDLAVLRPIGLAVPGDLDCATFRGDAIDGEVVLRQLRQTPIDVRLGLERLAVGKSGDSLDRLEVAATIALDGHDRWKGLERELRLIAAHGAHGADAHGGDAIDDGLLEMLETALESFVRTALVAADARAARDGSLAHAILPTGSAPLAGSFGLRALRVTRAAWTGAPHAQLYEAPEQTVTDAPADAAGDRDEADRVDASDVDVEHSDVEPTDAEHTDAEPADADAADRDTAATALVPAIPPDVADAPLAPALGSSPVLAEVWGRETGGDAGVVAIGGVVHGDSATVIVMHERPDEVRFSGALTGELGRALNVAAPRLLLLPTSPTLRDLLADWLAEQAVPRGVEAAVVVDDARRRVVLELSGDGAAGFVERVADGGAVDLAALGAVLPWSVALRAVGDDGLVEADGSGRAFIADEPLEDQP